METTGVGRYTDRGVASVENPRPVPDRETTEDVYADGREMGAERRYRLLVRTDLQGTYADLGFHYGVLPT